VGLILAVDGLSPGVSLVALGVSLGPKQRLKLIVSH